MGLGLNVWFKNRNHHNYEDGNLRVGRLREKNLYARISQHPRYSPQDLVVRVFLTVTQLLGGQPYPAK